MATENDPVDDELLELVATLNDLHGHASPEEIEAYLQSLGEYQDPLRQLVPALRALGTIKRGGLSDSTNATLADVSKMLDPPRQGYIGDFRLIRQLGRGGMGIVYEAEQSSLSRRVALKVLPPSESNDSQRIARFKNEANAAAQLNHPHIVQVYGVACDHGLYHIAMQYIDGTDLATWLAENQLFKQAGVYVRNSHGAPTRHDVPQELTKAAFERHERWVAALGFKIAEALAYAHRQGVVHRDIKPSNLMLDKDGKAWLTDFGVARFEDGPSLTSTGDLLGTLRYMSPEQACGRLSAAEQPAADVYALGATLYELLIGEPMRTGTDRVSLLRQAMHGRSERLRSRQPWVSPKLELVIMRAVMSEPAARYASAQQFAEALDAFIEERPLPVRRAKHFGFPRIGQRDYRLPRMRFAKWLAVPLLALLILSILISARRPLDPLIVDSTPLADQNLIPEGVENAQVGKYVSNLQHASQEWEGIQWDRMREYLSECVPTAGEEDPRCFAWHFLWQMLHGTPQPFGKHDGEAYFLAESPVDPLLASSGEDGIRIWDLRDWQQRTHLTDHKSDVNSIAFNEEGDRLVSSSDDGAVHIYDTGSWRRLHAVGGFHRVVSAYFFPETSNLLLIDRKDDPMDGRLSRMLLFSLEMQQTLWCINFPRDYAQNMAVNLSRRRAAIVSESGRLTVVDIDSGQKIAECMIASGKPMALDLDPTGSVVVSCTNTSIAFWRIDELDQPPVLEIDGGHGSLESLKFTTQGDLISASRNGYAVLWNLDWKNGVPKLLGSRRFKHGYPLWNARLTRDSRHLVSADRLGQLTRWDLNQPTAVEPRVIQADQIAGVDVSTKRKLASSIALFELLADRQSGWFSLDPFNYVGFQLSDNSQFVLEWMQQVNSRIRVLEVSRSPDRSLFAVRTDYDTRILRNERGEAEPRHVATLQMANALHWSPDSSQLLMACGWPVTLLTWNVHSGESREVDLGRFQAAGPVAWLADGQKIVFASNTGSIVVWDLGGSYAKDAFLAHREEIRAIAISPDERVLATTAGKSIQLWNLATRRPILQLALPSGTPPVFSLRFSQDGRCLGAEAGPPSIPEQFLLWEIESP